MEELRNRKILNMLNQYFEQMCDIDMPSVDIVLDDDYMQWIEDFMEKYPLLEDSDTYISFLKIYAADDTINQIRRLGNFGQVVDYYAMMNYLPIGNDSGVEYFNNLDFVHVYNVKFNDKFYEIGLCKDKDFGDFCYVKKNDDREIKSWIDFKDIQRGEREERAIKIDQLFAELDAVITKVMNEDVSEEMVINGVGKSLIKRYKNNIN